MEQREYPYGGAAPNTVTANIPPWVYEQVDDYLALPAILRPPDAPASGTPMPPESSAGVPALAFAEHRAVPSRTRPLA